MSTLADLTAADFPGIQINRIRPTPAAYTETVQDLEGSWDLRPDFAHWAALWSLVMLYRFEIPVRIISGRRSRQQTIDLILEGRPAVLNSQHRLGNALDFDLGRNNIPVKMALAGLVWTAWGFTWGGLFCRPDWNHLDGRRLDMTLPGYDVRISRAVDSIKRGVYRWTSGC